MWDVIVLIPDHCFSIYFPISLLLVTAAAEKWDISGSFDPPIFPRTRSYNISSIHNASVFPVKMDNLFLPLLMDTF